MKIKIAISVLFMCLAIIATSEATIFLGVDYKSFPADAVYDDDIFIGANKIRFQSEITGDLIGGSQELDFSGISSGNINWAAKWIIIKGPVDRSVRVAAQTIDINAPIGRNLLAFGQSINIGPATQISGDAYITGDIIEFEGFVADGLTIKGADVRVAGTISGNLNIEAPKIDIKPNTVIEGDLIYRSPEKIKIEESVIIDGDVRWTESEVEDEAGKYRAFSPITFMLSMFLVFNFICSLIVFIIALVLSNGLLIPFMFLALIVGGITIISLNKDMALKAVNILEKRFFAAFGLGLLLILLFPLGALLATATIIGMPIGLIIVFAFGIMTFAGAIYAAQFTGCNIGRLLNLGRKRLSVVTLIIGIIVLACLILIPVIGWIIAIVILASGLGAMTLSLKIFESETIVAGETVEPPQIDK